MATVRFVPSRAGISAVLKSDEVGAAIEVAARAAAPGGTVVSRIVGRTRQNIRIEDESIDALHREAEGGHLTGALGSVVL